MLFLRTPTSFLPEEDQGVFMTTAQLPSGATMVNTTKVLQQVTDYYLTKEKNNVQSVFTVGGFGFSGQGQNNGLAFISLKPSSSRSTYPRWLNWAPRQVLIWNCWTTAIWGTKN